MSRQHYGVYAWICDACGHPSSEHLLSKGRDVKAGPYLCCRCDCSIRQDAPMTGVTAAEFARRFPGFQLRHGRSS